MTAVVLDASALLALLLEEPGAARVKAILENVDTNPVWPQDSRNEIIFMAWFRNHPIVAGAFAVGLLNGLSMVAGEFLFHNHRISLPLFMSTIGLIWLFWIGNCLFHKPSIIDSNMWKIETAFNGLLLAGYVGYAWYRFNFG